MDESLHYIDRNNSLELVHQWSLLIQLVSLHFCKRKIIVNYSQEILIITYSVALQSCIAVGGIHTSIAVPGKALTINPIGRSSKA